MTSLPDLAETLCLAIARGESNRLKPLALQIAAKLSDRTPGRSSTIVRAFENKGPESLAPILLPINPSKNEFWDLVRPCVRAPWVPDSVWDQIAQWKLELDNATALLQAGEQVMPLLLVGETGCGKTSTALALAQDKPLYRFRLSQGMHSYLGETGKKLQQAISTCTTDQAFWLVDEIDGIAGKRTGDNAAAKDQAHAIGCFLTAMDSLDPRIPFLATSNLVSEIDVAVLRRFTIIQWPTWQELELSDKDSFLESHGCLETGLERICSYADAVKFAREQRVKKLLSK